MDTAPIVSAGQNDCALGSPLQPGQDPQCRRFAGRVWADKCDDFACADSQGHAAQNLLLAVEDIERAYLKHVCARDKPL